jgi:hypothetical protein
MGCPWPREAGGEAIEVSGSAIALLRQAPGEAEQLIMELPASHGLRSSTSGEAGLKEGLSVAETCFGVSATVVMQPLFTPAIEARVNTCCVSAATTDCCVLSGLTLAGSVSRRRRGSCLCIGGPFVQSAHRCLRWHPSVGRSANTNEPHAGSVIQRPSGGGRLNCQRSRPRGGASSRASAIVHLVRASKPVPVGRHESHFALAALWHRMPRFLAIGGSKAPSCA